MAPDLDALQEKLGHRFRNVKLLEAALTHPSVSHEHPESAQHNQRLEFLGDAVLGLVLTRELYEKFPDLEEGPLTKARAQLVNQRALSEQAQRLNLGDYLVMSRGELANGGRERPSTLADAFEAVIGAVFMDGGYVPACEFVLRCYRDGFGDFKLVPACDNPKGELQELIQSSSGEPPHYEVTASTGPDHDRNFECAVFHEGRELGRGSGKSKRMAESAAAMAALTTLRENRAQPA